MTAFSGAVSIDVFTLKPGSVFLIAGGRPTQGFPTPSRECPCHSKSLGLEELLLSLASSDGDTGDTQARSGECTFAGKGETNLCLANWCDKLGLPALLEEGARCLGLEA